MIHILNFESRIIDFFSTNDSNITVADHTHNIEEDLETLVLTVGINRSENFRERNRVLIEASDGRYREFIIQDTEDDLIEGETQVTCVASYLEDISKAKPMPPQKYDNMTLDEMLFDVLRATGWEVGYVDYMGIKDRSWTAYATPYEVLVMLKTTFKHEYEFLIEIEGNRVKRRVVNCVEPTNLFNGREIEYGKDLIGMTRTIDNSEVVTAYIGLGPEDDKGNRQVVEVVDNDAQEELGLPENYLWGIYEPESENDSMTKERLTTLTRTALNKAKVAAVSYEVEAVDIHKQFPHELIQIGDKVRIKNRDMQPALYADARVLEIVTDLINDTQTYKFGQVKEYNENTLRNYFNSLRAEFTKKLNDNINNLDTIISETVEGLDIYERKIFKGDTPPENPVNDALWYDTSNPDVAILRRYWNGEWIAATPEDVEQLGGMTREQIILGELNGTFSNLAIQHSKLLNDVYAIINNEYLVDNDIKNSVQAKLDDTITVYQQISANLDSMTEETATIGKLMDTQALFLTYRQKLQTLYISVENAQIAINERFKLLQSQYTQEKFNEAMHKVATSINGTFDEATGQLIADIPNQQELDDMRTTLESAMNDMSADNAKKLQELQEGITQTNQRITNTEEELSAGITSVTQKVDGLQVGGRNLLRSFTENDLNNIHTDITSTQSFNFSGWATELYSAAYLKNVLQEGKTYTLSYELEITELATSEMIYSKGHGLLFHVADGNSSMSISTQKQLEREIGNKMIVKHTFTIETLYDYRLIGYTGRYTGDGTAYGEPVTFNNTRITNLKLEEGNVATAWTPAPEDTQAAITKAQQDATDAAQAYADAQDNLKAIEAKAYADGIVDAEEQRAIDDAAAKLAQAKTYAEQKATEAKNAANANTTDQLKPIKTTVETQSADIKVLKDGIKLKADSTEVTKIYNNHLTPMQTQINAQKATLDVLPSQIAAKVSQTTYDTDMNNVVTRLNSADSERTQLSNEIKDRVTLTEYNSMKVGTENLLLNSKERTDLFGSSTHRRIVYKLTEPLIVGQEYTLTYNFEVTEGDNFGKTSIYAYEPAGNYAVVNIDNSTRNKYTFVAKAPSTLMLIYSAENSTPENDTTKIKITDAMLVKGNKTGDYKEAQQDTDQRLTTMETSISQNGTEIAQRATKEEFNASKQTLSRVLAEIVTNTTTGITLTYDENGGIQNFTLGPNGTMIDTKKLTIEAGDVSLRDGVFTVNKINTKNVTIPRDDGGVPMIINGVSKQTGLIQGMEPAFNGTVRVGSTDMIGFVKAGTWLGVPKYTSDQDYVQYNAYYFIHDRAKMTIPLVLNVGKTIDEVPCGIFVKIEEFGTSNNFSYYKGFTTNASEANGAGTINYSFDIDLGPPTGKIRQFYIFVKPNAEGRINSNGDFSKPYSVAKFAIRPIRTYD